MYCDNCNFTIKESKVKVKQRYIPNPLDDSKGQVKVIHFNCPHCGIEYIISCQDIITYENIRKINDLNQHIRLLGRKIAKGKYVDGDHDRLDQYTMKRDNLVMLNKQISQKYKEAIKK
jgi:hypothetical protein